MNWTAILLSFLILLSTEGKVISFDEATKLILIRSPVLQASRARLYAEKEGRLAGYLNFLPDLSASLSQNKSYANSLKSRIRGKSLIASMNLFKGGSDYFSLMAARYRFDYQESLLSNAELKSEEEAIQSLVNYIQKEKLVGIAKEQEKLWIDSLKTARLRFRKGLTPRQEVDKARIDLLNAKARSKSREITFEKARADLLALMGNADTVSTHWPWIKRLKSLNKKKIKTKDYNGDNNLETKAFKLKSISDEKEVSSKWSSFLPRLDFSYSWSDDNIKSASFDTNDQKTALLTLTIPLFDGWSDKAAIERARANLAVSHSQYTVSKRKIEALWQARKLQLIQALETAFEREKTVKLSRRLYRDNFNRFKGGRATVNDLQVDQNRLLESENLTNDGWAEVHLAWMKYCHHQGFSVFGCSE